MATPVTMPVLGLTMEEGTVAEWLKQEGDAVARDEPLLTVEMDKGTVEVPSPVAGVLQRIIVSSGTTVAIKTVIAEIGEPRDLLASPLASPLADGSQRLFASPRARLPARELGVELSSLRGSGPHGRVVEADVMRAAGARIIPEDAPRTAIQRLSSAAPETQTGADAPPLVEAAGVRPLSRMRRITAERMAASARAAARVTLFLEADFSAASHFRRQLQPEFARLGVAKLPWEALIARAAALALQEHPVMLAQWVEGEGLREQTSINVGIAVALDPEGLVVPVLEHAATRSLRALAADLLSMADRARASRLTPHEMDGGTFTITNLGAYRIDGFTPIANPPETAILGVGRIADKPVVVDGKIEVRTMCTLSLSFDHRVVDGAPAAAFLSRLAELLERPYALLEL